MNLKNLNDPSLALTTMNLNAPSLASIPMNLKILNDPTLISTTDGLVQNERELLTKLLHHFREIERRRLFSDLGYKSLYDMLVRKYGYSEDQAYRRISAMRLLSEIPEIEEKINQGDLNLTHLGLAQSLFRQERKTHQAEVSKEDKLQVLKAFSNQSTREAEKIAVTFSSKPEEFKSDRVRVVSETKVEMRFLASQDLATKIETLKGWLAHQHPEMSLGDLFEKLCDLGLHEWDPRKTAALRKRRVKIRTGNSPNGPLKDSQESSLKNRQNGFVKSLRNSSGKDPLKSVTRRMPSPSVRRLIFEKSDGKCEICGSLSALEVDHIRPWSQGGDSRPENLRLLCRNCNQRAAIRELGFQKMNPYLHR